MSLVLLEGLDRTGKSTVAEFFQSKGYELIHLSAPKVSDFTAGYTYLDSMVDLLQKGALNDLVIDRTHYGELVWPQIYNRKSLLGDEDYEILREIEESIGVKRILMHDPNTEAHWQRCIDNNEPLTKAQFTRARSIYSSVGQKYGFESVTLPNFCKEFNIDVPTIQPHVVDVSDGLNKNTDITKSIQAKSAPRQPGPTPHLDQRQLLEKANAINDILDKRILKKSGTLYDELENDIRMYLNEKLAAIFGNTEDKPSFTNNEMTILKAMVKRITDKEN